MSLLNIICDDNSMANILYLVGLVVAVIRIAVPIILIVIGMVDLVKAITSQDDKQIKSATNLLVKRVVIGVAVFLVPTIVHLLFSTIIPSGYSACKPVKCVTNVWAKDCKWK